MRAFLCDAKLTPELERQIGCVLDRKLALYVRAPLWCVPELPRRTAAHLGLSESLGLDLAVAALLYHCAADIVDDAQDYELPAIPGWGSGDWRDAVNVGLYLLSAHSKWLAGLGVSAAVRTVWADLFAQAGMTLIVGQHRDLRAVARETWDESDVLSLGAQKAGGALGAVMCLAPAAVGEAALNPWRELGILLGQMFQAASDLEAYMGYGPHADLAQMKVTLPLVFAKDADVSLAEFWALDVPLGLGTQERLRAAVRATGALEYTRWRIEALHHECLSLAQSLATERYADSIRPVLDTALVSVAPVPV